MRWTTNLTTLDRVTETLIGAAQDGDDVALQQLYARYYPRVERIVRSRIGPRLRSLVEIEDVLQDVFLEAILRLEDFEMRSEAAFLKWLAAIATNKVRKEAEHWGREKRNPERVLSIDGSAQDAVSSRVREISARITGPVTRAIRNERDIALEEALDTLEEDQREALLLRHFAGCSHAELATELARPTEAAAREFYRRARAKLVVQLRRQGFSETDLASGDL